MMMFDDKQNATSRRRNKKFRKQKRKKERFQKFLANEQALLDEESCDATSIRSVNSENDIVTIEKVSQSGKDSNDTRQSLTSYCCVM
jgi:hypothetical protein